MENSEHALKAGEHCVQNCSHICNAEFIFFNVD